MSERKVEKVRAVVYVLPEVEDDEAVFAILREKCREAAAERGFELCGDGQVWVPDQWNPAFNTKPEGVPEDAITVVGEFKAVRK